MLKFWRYAKFSVCIRRGYACLQSCPVNITQFYYPLSFVKPKKPGHTECYFVILWLVCLILPNFTKLLLVELCVAFAIRSHCFLLVPFAFLSSSVEQRTSWAFHLWSENGSRRGNLVKKGREEAPVPSSNVSFTMRVILAVWNLDGKLNCFAEILWYRMKPKVTFSVLHFTSCVY